MQSRIRRAAFWAIVFAVGSSIACTEMAGPTKPSQEGLGTENALTNQSTGQGGLEVVRQATAAFHDIGKAVAAGYRSPVGGPCESSAAGAMGVHSANRALQEDQALDPEEPEILLYLPDGTGDYRLVGVEYMQIVLVRNTVTGVVSRWSSPDIWPPEYVVVNPAPSLFGQTFDGPMAGHNPGRPWHYDLHVWAWAPNPSGAFAQWNPSLSCK